MSKFDVEKAKAAVLGAFVADAATLPCHWEYDPAKVAAMVKDHADTPEFNPIMANKFYSEEEFPGHYALGQLSPYAEQAVAVLEYLADNAEFDEDSFAKFLFQWGKAYTGRLDHATKQFIENVEGEKDESKWKDCGADDFQANAFLKVAPIALRYAGHPDYLDVVAKAIRVHQNHQGTIAFGVSMAIILEHVILGGTLADAIGKAKEHGAGIAIEALKDAKLSAVIERGEVGTGEEIQSFFDSLEDLAKLSPSAKGPPMSVIARACMLPYSFVGPIKLIVDAGASGDEAVPNKCFQQAIRENLLAAGDNCSRASFIGSVLAAAGSSVPEAWVEQTKDAAYVQSLCKKVLKHRS